MRLRQPGDPDLEPAVAGRLVPLAHHRCPMTAKLLLSPLRIVS